MKLRDELAGKYISLSSPEITRFTMSWHFKDGFDACEARYLQIIEKLESALNELSTSGRGWIAEEALAELAEFKNKMNGDK